MRQLDIPEAAILTDSPMMPGFKLGYRPELDGLRGISILLVMVHHFYHLWLPGGFLGVDIFFVLSGFLITSLLLQEWNSQGTISIKNFYIRRALRLMPALGVIILVLGVLALTFLTGSIAAKTYQGIWLTLSYVSNLLYAFNYYSADNPLGVTWSLAIEEQFYLFWPLILRYVLRSGMTRRKLLSTLTLTVVVLVLYRILLVNLGASIKRLYYASDSRADGLLIGCLVAILVAQDFFPKSRRFEVYAKVLAAMAFLYLAWKALSSTWIDLWSHQGVGFTVIPLCAAMILVVLIKWPPRIAVRALSLAPLVWIGQVSYGLYLWHWPARWFIYNQRDLPASTGQLVSAVVLTLALTTLSYYLIERPCLRLKKGFSGVSRSLTERSTDSKSPQKTLLGASKL